MKKVLIVVSSLSNGGTERYIFNNIRNMPDKDISFDFYVLSDCVSKELKVMDKRNFKIYTYSNGLKSKTIFVYDLVKFLKKNKYDVVHSHINTANSWVMLASMISGVPIRISHSHTVTKTDSIIRKAQRIVIKYCANVFLACGKDAGCSCYGEEFFLKKGIVAQNGIDIDSFVNENSNNVSKLKKEYNILDDNVVIGNISRFDCDKNITFLIDIFYEINKYDKNCILVLGGTDLGELKKIKEKISLLKIEKYVRIIGERSDVNDWLHIFDIYILPSLEEGLPIGLLEAQAAGVKCLISSDVTREVDMGLDLTEFIDLKDGPQKWAKKVLDNDKCSPRPEDIVEKFRENGYLISQTAEALYNIYKNGV